MVLGTGYPYFVLGSVLFLGTWYRVQVTVACSDSLVTHL